MNDHHFQCLSYREYFINQFPKTSQTAFFLNKYAVLINNISDYGSEMANNAEFIEYLQFLHDNFAMIMI